MSTLQAAQYFLGKNQVGQSVSLCQVNYTSPVIGGGSFLLAVRPTFNMYLVSVSGTTVENVAATLPGEGTEPGFAGIVADVSGNGWAIGYRGPAIFVPVTGSMGPEQYPLPTNASGEIFVGLTYTNGYPYFGAGSGDLYLFESGAVSGMPASFGELLSAIASDSGHLYGLLPSSQHLGVLTFTSATSGTVAKYTTPMTRPAAFAVGASGVAVGGWSSNTLASGATCLAESALGYIALASETAGSVELLTGTDPSWSVAQTVSGLGHPFNLAWTSSGIQLLVTDPVAGKVDIFTQETGLLVSGTSLSVANATNIATTLTTGQALVTQPASNEVTVLTSFVDTWAVSGVVSGLANPMGLCVISDTAAVVGSPSGVTFLQYTNNTWSIGHVVSGLAFTPDCLALSFDVNANPVVYAAGTAGVSGHVGIIDSAGIAAQASWAGAASGIFYEQGQIAVADPVNSLVRVFDSLLNLQNSITAPTGVQFIGQSGVSVWLCGTASVWQDRFTAPFRLVPYNNGQVSFFSVSGFAGTATLGVEQQPSAMVWGPSGVWVATEQNDLFVVSPSGGVVSQQTVLPQAPQTEGTPLGMSALMIFQDGLWSASSLANGPVILIDGALP